MIRPILRIAGCALLFFLLTSTAFAAGGSMDFRVFVPKSPYFPLGTSPGVPAYLAIRSSAEWVAFWSAPGRLQRGRDPVRSTIDVSRPDIDFDHFTLLFVSPGPKPSGGYSVAISSIWEMGDQIRVSIISVSPLGTNCAQTTMDAHPAVWALIAKTQVPIVFDVSEAGSDCVNSHHEI
jgi:hypothetical protein